MLQDIFPKQYHVEFTWKNPQMEDLCFVFRGQETLERLENNQLRLPTYGELSPLAEGAVYLFRVDERDYFLVWLKEGALPVGYEWHTIRGERRKKSKEMVFAEATAHHLDLWYRANRFCGHCSAPTEHDRRERMLRCPACGEMIFPKICPAVIVAVTDGERILLSRYQRRTYKGYGLIAGFVEIGETAEETVRREVMEEVGLRVKDIRYYGSQPWGLAGNLSLGYFARLVGDDAIYLDGKELSEAGWYRREEIDLETEDYSLTNDMIQAFRRGEHEERTERGNYDVTEL